MNRFFLLACLASVSFVVVIAEDCSAKVNQYSVHDCGRGCVLACKTQIEKAKKEECEKACIIGSFMSTIELKDKLQGTKSCSTTGSMGFKSSKGGYNVLAPLTHGMLKFKFYSKSDCSGDSSTCGLKVGKCYSMTDLKTMPGCFPYSTVLELHKSTGVIVTLKEERICKESTLCYNTKGGVIPCHGGFVQGGASVTKTKKLYTGPSKVSTAGAQSVSVAMASLALIGLPLAALN